MRNVGFFGAAVALVLTCGSWNASRSIAQDVEVTPLGGKPVSGKLTELSPERLVVQAATGPATFDVRQLTSAKFASPDVTATADVSVELLDGSRLVGESFSLKSGRATVGLPGGVSVTVRSRALRAVRLRKPQTELDSLWRAQVEKETTGDLLIIRKTGKGATDNETVVVLDRQSGIIQEVTDAVVQFELDGDRIPVKREKLEGLVFYQSEERELPDAWCRLDDTTGSFWVTKAVRLKGDEVEVETVGGATAKLPLARLRKLDFSVGNTVYLSDLEPDSVEWLPFVESRSESLQRRNQPRRDQAFDGGKLMLGNQSYDKGLSLHSRTTMVYRVPRNFRRLIATVGIDDRVRENGNVRFVVQGDGKTLFETPITGRDRPKDIEVDLAGAKRLTILVDFGEELDVADFLDLCNARFTK